MVNQDYDHPFITNASHLTWTKNLANTNNQTWLSLWITDHYILIYHTSVVDMSSENVVVWCSVKCNWELRVWAECCLLRLSWPRLTVSEARAEQTVKDDTETPEWVSLSDWYPATSSLHQLHSNKTAKVNIKSVEGPGDDTEQRAVRNISARVRFITQSSARFIIISNIQTHQRQQIFTRLNDSHRDKWRIIISDIWTVSQINHPSV